MSLAAAVFTVVCVFLLIATLLHTVVGMALASIALAGAGMVIFQVATGGIHEATASILLVGAAICAGVAGISRDLRRRQGEVETSNKDQ